MKLQIRPITNKSLWENFYLYSPFASIFQSWNMGEAEKQRGEEIERIGFYKGEKLQGIAQMFFIRAKRGYFLHVRGGPLFKNWQDFPNFFPLLKSYAKEKRAIFIRISPPILISEAEKAAIIDQLGFKDAVIPFLDAEASWVLNLERSSEEILKNMRKTTRYLIKKAKKKGVVVEKSQSIKAVKTLLKLYNIMVREKGIVPHQGIIEEFAEFVKDGQALVLLGFYKRRLLGAALIIFYRNEGIYHHSAHLRSEEDVPVSYLLQWEAICESQRRGKKWYNFWGIEPTGNPNHPWAGLSQFKKGFGGNLRQFIRAKDYSLSPFYFITFLVEKIRLIKRYKTFH